MKNYLLLNIVLFYGTIWDLLLIIFLFFLTVFIFIRYVIPNFKKRKVILSIIFSVISLCLLFLIVVTSIEYVKERKYYREDIDYYVEKAEEDIKKDLVELRYYGMFTIVKEEHSNKIDSIAKKYGVKLIPIGDDVYEGPLNEKAKDKYDEITNSYLNKRNGFGWGKQMDKELEPYIERGRWPSSKP